MSKEERSDVMSLQEQVRKLKSQLASTQKQLHQATEQLEKKKKEVERLQKTSYLNKKDQTNFKAETAGVVEIVPGRNPGMEIRRTQMESISVPQQVDSGLLDVAKRLKQRCFRFL